jgi:hypothetical protein
MSQEKKSGPGCLKIAGAGCLSLLCLLLVVGFLGYRAYQRVQTEVTPLLTDFVSAMEAEDKGKVAQLSVEGSFKEEEIEALMEARYLFEGFQSLSIDNGGITKSANTNPLLSGTIAKTSGTIQYQNGDVGRFTAMAKIVGSDWRVLNIHVEVDKARYDRWMKDHPKEEE